MNKELSGAQKAAILLRAIGEEAAAAVMKTLDPKDIRKLGSFMKETANITKQEEDSVIAEFRAGELIRRGAIRGTRIHGSHSEEGAGS
ncbi:MAG: hypothetical protein IPM88_08735 [Nitrospira sp.]|nr:hypothetical protein [Nitrospira sp.]